MSRFLAPYRAYVSKITDASYEYAEAGGLALLSTIALGRRMVNRGSGIHPNIFMLLMANSSTDRKSTIVENAVELIRDVDESRLGPDDFTPEALLSVMRVHAVDKKGNVPPSRNKMLLPISEFGMLLSQTKNYAATMAPTMCRIYDGASFERVRVGAGGSLRVRDPRVSMLGGCAFAMMREYQAEGDWGNGFYARTIFVIPKNRPPPFASQPIRLQADYDQIRMLLADLCADLNRPCLSQGGMQITAGADKIYEQWIAAFVKPSENDIMRTAQFARLQTITYKIAMLYQIDIDPMADIGIQAMDAAIQFANRAWVAFEFVYMTVSGTNRSKQVSRVWQEISDAKENGLTRRGLLRNTHWTLDVVQPLADFLVDAGVVRKVVTGNAVRYFILEPFEEELPT